MHSTNYYNTFIAIADDCRAGSGEIPPQKSSEKTTANLQYEMIRNNPYQYTSDDVLFSVHAAKNDLTDIELPAERKIFFSKGQPCLRASPLTKRYGWGVHSNAEGKIALYPAGSAEYQKLLNDNSLTHTRAIRSKRQ